MIRNVSGLKLLLLSLFLVLAINPDAKACMYKYALPFVTSINKPELLIISYH